MHRKFERNAEIVRLHREEGLSLAEIAERFGISRERVRQIYKTETGGGSLTNLRYAEVRTLNQIEAERRKFARVNRHGRHMYIRYGCRCIVCTTAVREHRESLKGKEPPTHGYSGYCNYGCRCPICKEAGRIYNHKRYEK